MSPDDTLQLYREAMGDTGGENRDMEDRVERLRASRALADVAAALGPEATRARLLPLCEGYMLAEEEEVQLLLAGVLGDFVTAVGGPGYAHTLIAPLKVTI